MVEALGHAVHSYRTVICDESHQLKSRTAKRTRFLSAAVRAAARAILLTGTPLLSRPIEAWPQVRLLHALPLLLLAPCFEKGWGQEGGSGARPLLRRCTFRRLKCRQHTLTH